MIPHLRKCGIILSPRSKAMEFVAYLFRALANRSHRTEHEHDYGHEQDARGPLGSLRTEARLLAVEV